MKERPILLSEDMVRAILDDRKGETRRIISGNTSVYLDQFFGDGISKEDDQSEYSQTIDGDGVRVWLTEYEEGSTIIKCPKGNIGDHLWVRETWAKALGSGLCRPLERYIKDDGNLWGMGAIYKSSPHPDYGLVNSYKWKPSIHMPRWASRITLEITGIRVERVQDITEAGAHASGVSTGRWGYRKQWEEFYGNKSWLDNPWVWVIYFKRFK